MEIHILRDGNEIGPFSEITVQSLLKQGSVLLNDPAWSPGMPNWMPLHAVLYPAAQSEREDGSPGLLSPPPHPSEDEAALEDSDPSTDTEEVGASISPLAVPATSRQKAFLSFMGVAFSGDLTKEQAALLVNDAMENPKDAAKLQRWNEDRFRLHPDIFAEEIKARKDNRASHYFEVCHSEGAEFFENVTKAHTQVLVGFLDVRYPNWDLREDEAKFNYFFPAIAEKFPQLVKNTAKGKFKYPGGPKVSAELARHSGAPRGPRSSGSPIGAIFRGLVFGAIILAAVFFGREYLKSRAARLDHAAKTASPSTTANQPAANSSSDASAPSTGPDNASTAVATVSNPFDPLAPTPSLPMSAAQPPTPPASESAAATPLAQTTLTPEPPAPEPAAPATPAPRTTVKLTKPTVIALPFGSSTLRVGTSLPLVSVNGAVVKVKFGPDVVSIPVSHTDIGAEGPPANP